MKTKDQRYFEAESELKEINERFYKYGHNEEDADRYKELLSVIIEYLGQGEDNGQAS